MSKQGSNNIRLGIFVLSGLFVLVISMYLIGKNQNLFGSSFMVKARFADISGLTAGNNVRFSGINAGTVKSIHIINDTCIEVQMIIDTKLQPYIHKNSIVDIGNEGLMGNKVVNITPVSKPSPSVEEGDLLLSKADVNTGMMLETFSHTNDNVEVISTDLKVALKRLNDNKPLWNLLEDTTLTRDVKATLSNFRKSSETFSSTTNDLHELMQNVKKGEGIAGVLFADKKEAESLKSTIEHIKKVSDNADRLTARLDSIAQAIQTDMNHGHGTIQTLLKDTGTAARLNKSLMNIEQGSATFKQEMEALKQNRFMKKYIKKQAAEKKVEGN